MDNELTAEQLEARRASARTRYALRKERALDGQAAFIANDIARLLGIDLDASQLQLLQIYIRTNFKLRV